MTARVSTLTRRYTPLRESVYRLLVTFPSQEWTVADMCADLGGGSGLPTGQVRDVVYLLLADRVLTEVKGNRALTVALTADGRLALDEVLSDWAASATMDIGVGREIISGITFVSLSGELTLASSSQVRQVLMKCVADCPAAVIVNLRDLRLGHAGLISVFATAHEHAMREYGVPVLYVEASEELTLRLAAFHALVHLFSTQSAAVLGLSAWVPHWWCQTMQPVAASVKAARDMVDDACRRWGLDSLRDPARLIASELVTNAVTHTHQPFDITISHSRLYLRIGVRDSSNTVPRPPADSRSGTSPSRGETPDTWAGLEIVQATATHWGTTPMPDGKVVWAMLRV